MLLRAASLGALLCAAGALACLTSGRDCSLDAHCCSGMVCQKAGGGVYGVCAANTAEQSSTTYNVNFYSDRYYQGSKFTVRLDEQNLGNCLHPSWMRGDVSSIEWGDNVAIMVYDHGDCGGLSHLMYPSGSYKLIGSKAVTRNYGFYGRGEPALDTVCKRDRCGYTSTSTSRGFDISAGALSVSHGTSSDITWENCECLESWDNGVQSWRLFRRQIGTSKDVR